MKTSIWADANRLIETPVESRIKFKGNLLHLYLDTVVMPDGSQSEREWIKHPGACAVVPVFRDGTIMLVKQFRYPIKQIFYEVPAGKIDTGEPPEITASRETEEETGLRSNFLQYIGHFYPGIGYSDEIIHIYTAWDLEQFKEHADDDEFLINIRLPFSKAIKMIENGEITDAKSICSLLQTKMWWERNSPFDIDFS